MANKNTIRLRRSLERSRKTGSAITTENGGRWKGAKIPDQEKIVAEIRRQTQRVYG